LNKGDLIDAVAVKLGVTKANASLSVDAVLEAIAEGVAQEEKVALSGFGTFKKSHRKGRTGHHPITKQIMEIKPSTSVQFKPSQVLKDHLN
jgi:nucleoid DNA-binding protein